MGKIWRKVLTACLTLALIWWTSFFPFFAYAQETNQSEPVAETVVESQPTPETQETTAPSSEPILEEVPASTESAEVVAEPDLTSTETVSATPRWFALDDSTDITTGTVVVNEDYQFRDTPVLVRFTKLPDPAGTLTIKEVKLTSEQVEELGALSDTAYDITSSMADGSFSYDLTLPLPEAARGQPVEVKADGEIVDQPKEVKTETITITGLDHFTVFVLVNDTDNGGSASTTDDVANGQIATLKDTWIDETAANQDENHGDEQTFKVQSRDTSRNQRALIQFDLTDPSISSANTIDKATLRLYMTSAPSNNRTYQIYRLDSADWVEGNGGQDNNPTNEVRWNNKPTSSLAATSATTTGTVDNVWIEFDVTTDVAAFLSGTANYGWLIVDASESESGTARTGTFRSRQNGTDNQRPQLVVDFTESADEPTDYKSPSASIADTGGDGNGFENNADNAFTDGGSEAVDRCTTGTDLVNTKGYASNCAGAADRHIFYNYGFGVPAESTINGIEVRADWFLDDETGSVTNSLSVELSWDGGTTWTATKSDSTETDREHISSFGGTLDNWGRVDPWTADDFTDANFRIRVTSNSTNASRDFALDWIPARVYYTPDTIAPTNPGTPTTTTPTNNDTPTWTWDAAVDTNLDHYIFFWDTILGGETNDSGNILANFFTLPLSLSEGTWYGKVKAFDTVGNFSTSGDGSVLIDTTLPTDPTPSSASHTVSSWNSDTTVDAIWSGADDPGGSGVDGFYTEWNTSSTTLTGPVVKEYEETADAETSPSLSTEQDHYFHIATVDNAGNWTSTAHLGPFWIDADDPVISLDSPVNGALLKGTVSLQSSASDIGSGLNPVEFSYEKSTEVSFTSIGIDATDPYGLDWLTTGVDDGDYTLRAAASDNSGRISWSDVNVTVDNTEPTITVDTLTTSDSTPGFSGTIDDNDATIALTIDGNTYNDAYTNGDGTWSLDEGIIDPLPDGTYDVLVSATDTAGNVGNDGTTDELLVDTTAPDEPVADPVADDYTSNQSVTLASDDGSGSGVFNIYYTTDGTTPDNTSTVYTGAITVDQDMTIKAIAYDNVGNPSGILSAVYNILPPEISGETHLDVTTGGITITWTTDHPATSRVIFDKISHDVLGAAPNYGYAVSTVEDPALVLDHSVVLTGLESHTVYYYRVVSHGSPEAVSEEFSYQTKSLDEKDDPFINHDPVTGPSGPSGGGGDGGGGGTVTTAAAITPSGGTISGLPGGFAEGVLGAATEPETIETLPQTLPTGETLGETQKNSTIPWWWWLSIPVIIGLWMTAKAFKR